MSWRFAYLEKYQTTKVTFCFFAPIFFFFWWCNRNWMMEWTNLWFILFIRMFTFVRWIKWTTNCLILTINWICFSTSNFVTSLLFISLFEKKKKGLGIKEKWTTNCLIPTINWIGSSTYNLFSSLFLLFFLKEKDEDWGIHLAKANLLMNKINHKLVHSIIQFLLHHQKKKKWVQKNKMSLLWFDIFPSKRNANSQKWLIIIILYTPNTAVIPPKKNSIIAVIIENLDLEVIFCDYTQNLEKTKWLILILNPYKPISNMVFSDNCGVVTKYHTFIDLICFFSSLD